MTDEEKIEALLLAGKLSNKAKRVVESNTKSLSEKIEALEIAINEYDNYILEHLEVKDESPRKY